MLLGIDAAWAASDTTFTGPLDTVTDMVSGTGGQLAAALAVGAALVGSVLRFNAMQLLGAVGVRGRGGRRHRHRHRPRRHGDRVRRADERYRARLRTLGHPPASRRSRAVAVLDPGRGGGAARAGGPGLAANQFVTGLVAGAASWLLLRRVKRGGGANIALYGLYWFLPGFVLRLKGTPASHRRRFAG